MKHARKRRFQSRSRRIRQLRVAGCSGCRYGHDTAGESASYQFVQIYAQRAEPGRALDWLDAAYRVGDTGLHYMKVDPLVDPLRSEPRFKAMLARVKFPD